MIYLETSLQSRENWLLSAKNSRMYLYQRIKSVLAALTLSQSEMARRLGMPQRTFQGYLNEKRQDNLWPLLPRILELYPRLSRQWLYFEEGPMFIGQDVPLDQPVPLQTVQQAVELMARDAAGTNKTLLQLVAGQAGEQDTAEKVRALEEKLREREAELAEERRLNRRLTAKLLLEGNAEEGSGQNTGNEAASGQ